MEINSVKNVKYFFFFKPKTYVNYTLYTKLTLYNTLIHDHASNIFFRIKNIHRLKYAKMTLYNNLIHDHTSDIFSNQKHT